ncbi:hypothetical protein [[Acholeplasma] multilocale]|uniref:hypothetical protein n=1 Tax=[Acholeplasma] multilocale TaxID=264638 RepID=UPI00047C0F6A|nr:hypothetical protein [[Acholeplasma] multilocale]
MKDFDPIFYLQSEIKQTNSRIEELEKWLFKAERRLRIIEIGEEGDVCVECRKNKNIPKNRTD